MNAPTLTSPPQAPAKRGDAIGAFLEQEYVAGFETRLETDSVPKGLSEDIVRTISARKGEPEWLLEWRLRPIATG